MKTRVAHTLRLLMIASLLGCYNLTGRTVADGGDAAEEPRADVSDASDASDDGDVTALGDAVDATDSADASDAPDVADVEDAPDVADAAEAGCDGGAVMCEGACVDLATTTAHCGRCDNACPTRANAAASCVAGACVHECSAGFADCDGDASNGCEAALSSVTNCGRCGAHCDEPTPLCGEVGGVRQCVSGCSAGETRCAMSCVDTASDAANCGRCGNVCAMGATCSAGVCACPSGQSDCHGACRETGASCVVGRGACMRTGAIVCAATGTETQCSVTPGVAGTETCNGVDDDCDGLTDEGFCRIAGSCYVDGQVNPANACQRCVALPSADGATAWGSAAAGAVCRAAAGPCDVAETCDGSGAACPANAFVAAPRGYTRSSPSLPFIDACSTPGHQTYLPLSDDSSVSVVLPFAFNFYGSAFSSAGLSTNGVISFPWSASLRDYANQPLPYAGISDAIFAFWDDVMTGTNGVCVATVGSAPNRQFIAQWSDANFCCTADPASRMNFEVVLGEATGSIDVRFGDTGVAPRASGEGATIGIQQGTGASYDMVAYNTAGSAATGRSYRWTPAGTVCRPSSSVASCDPAESCSGTSAECPADVVTRVPSGEICDGVDNNCDGVVDEASAVAACPPRPNATSACSMGACRLTCSAGFADCDGDASNGCETDTQTSTAHCGACRNACASGGACVSGACVRGCWRPMSAVGAPPESLGAIDPVWTGQHVLIWGGGTTSGVRNTGGLYDPLADRWTAMTTVAAPSGRHAYGGVWSGSKFIVYGGYGFGGGAFIYDGAQYDAVNDRWIGGLPISYRGAASPVTAWTGSHMFVWSGGNGYDTPQLGALYDPSSGAVVSIPSAGAPPGRAIDWSTAWTGTQVLVAGGVGGGRGGRYDPLENRWLSMSATNAPPDQYADAGVWTGARFVVWGGQTPEVAVFSNRGSMYDPTADTWTLMSTVNAPSARTEHCMVWTGSRVIVWGGRSGGVLGDGAEFDPVTNSWAALPTEGAPSPRSRPRCVWTGRELVVWGGVGSSAFANGARYVPGCVSPPRYRSDATPRVSDVGLVAHYEFEDDLSDSTRMFGDGVGRGTVAYTDGRFGRALALDGSTTLVRLPDAPNWREFTVAAYVRSTGAPRSAYIVNGWDVSREHFALSTWSTTTGVRMDGGNHPQVLGYPYSEIHARDPSPWASDVWRHVAVTADATVVTLYVDGVAVASTNQGTRYTTSAPQPLTGIELGGSSRNAGIFFRGALDDLRIYNRALPPSEVAALTGRGS